MANKTDILANSFVGHLKNLEKTRSKQESLINIRAIVRRDIEQVYSGLYLDAVSSLERFIEDLFIGLLVGRLVHNSSQIIPRVSFKSDRVARQVVFSGRNYVDWFPYRFTEDRAEAFFRRGLPFKRLDADDKRKIETILCIRNSFAHRSSHSLRMFKEKILGSQILLPREKTPAGYLRGIFRIYPIQTRYENLILEMSGIALKLCT